MRVVVGETVTLSCSGNKVARTKSIMALVKCVQKEMFLLNSTIVDIDQLGCTRNPREKEILVRKGVGQSGLFAEEYLSQIPPVPRLRLGGFTLEES